jgi:type I restriction enzyme S subunit
LVDFDGCCSGDAFVLRENHDKVVPGFLAFFMNSNALWDFANENAAGTMSKRVKWRDLANYECLLPPKDQQAQLAELLWAMDEVVEREREVLEKTSSYIESLIHENLTTRKGGKTLADYCENDGIRIGPFGSLLHVKDYVQKGVPVIMPANIIDGKIHTNQLATISHNKAIELERYRVETNDIIFPRRGELSKRTIINEKQNGWICGTGSIRVRLSEKYNIKLAYYALTSQFVNAWLLDGSVGTTMPNLNASTISKIPLNLPEGHKADDIFNEIELALKAKDINMIHISTSKALQKSLINQIF